LKKYKQELKICQKEVEPEEERLEVTSSNPVSLTIFFIKNILGSLAYIPCMIPRMYPDNTVPGQ
jgi:hypothetical protein